MSPLITERRVLPRATHSSVLMSDKYLKVLRVTCLHWIEGVTGTTELLTILDRRDLNAMVTSHHTGQTSGTLWQLTTQRAASCIKHYQTTLPLTSIAVTLPLHWLWLHTPTYDSHWSRLSWWGKGGIVLSCKLSYRSDGCSLNVKPGMRCWSLTFRPGDTPGHSRHWQLITVNTQHWV